MFNDSNCILYNIYSISVDFLKIFIVLKKIDYATFLFLF